MSEVQLSKQASEQVAAYTPLRERCHARSGMLSDSCGRGSSVTLLARRVLAWKRVHMRVNSAAYRSTKNMSSVARAFSQLTEAAE